MCKNWIVSGYKEELYGVLDVIASLVLKQSGVEVILGNEELQIAFFALSLKTDTTMKQKFLFTYSQFFSEEFDKKLSAYMKKAFAMVGHIEDLVHMKKTVQEVPTNGFDRSFKWLLKILHVPFVDIEQEALVLLKNVLRFDWSVMDFAKQENSVSYLTEHLAKSKEIYDLKREIIREIVTRLEESKDIFMIEFRKKLIAGKSNMKGPADKTSYATEVL